MATAVNVTEIIDARRIGSFQKRIAILCAAIVFVEGFNTQAVGYIAPALRQSWRLSPANLTWFFALGLFGLLLGALFIAPLADRFGRRPLLLGSVAFFAAAALLTGMSTSIPMLDVSRFLTGLGIGGAMPNAIALTSEYAPRHRRSLLIALMFTGFVVGSVTVGLLSTWLIPLFGWESILVSGGVLGLLLLPVLFCALPESVRFLALRAGAEGKAKALLARVDPGLVIAEDAYLVPGEASSSGVSVGALFRDGRAKRTLLLWVIYFTSLLDLFLLANWLPTEMQALGVSPALAIVIGTLFQLGGVFGVGFGWMADRLGAGAAIGTAYFVGSLCIAGVALAGANVPFVIVAVFGAGLGLIGGQSVTNATAAIAYPTDIRSTGVGWATGIGRIGSIIGPTVAGYMHTMNVATASIFLFAVIPALCAAVAAACLGPLRTIP